MSANRVAKIVAALSLCVAAYCIAAPLCDDPPRLRFSLVPQGDVRKDAAAFQPLFAALETELGKPVEVVYPSSYGSVVEGLMAASIDLAFMGPASYATAKNSDPDVQAFANYARKAGAFQEEGSYYRSLLIVRGDSGFSTSESLKGARLALVDPASTSGAVLPRHLFSPLVKAPLEQFFGRVVYTGGHDKSASAVATGQVDAAFVASNHLSDFISEGKAEKNDYRVLWQSEPIPLDPFVYRGRLCPAIKEGIRKVFLGNNGRQFRSVLDRLGASHLSPVSDDNYKLIRDTLRAVP